MNHKPFMNEFDFGMEDDRNLWSLIDAPGFVLPNNPSVHRVHTFTIIDIVTQMFPPVLKAVNAWKEQLVQQRQKKQTAIKPLIDFCDVHKIVHDHILPLAHRVRMSDASGKVGLEENVWGIGLPAYYMVSPSPMRPPPSFTVITRDQALRQMHPSPHADRSALGPSYAEQIDWSRYIFKYAPSAGASWLLRSTIFRVNIAVHASLMLLSLLS